MPKHISRFGFMLVAALAVASAGAPSQASAQTDPDPVATPGEQVDASPKGLIGLGIIGAELGLVIPAVAGLDETWSLITFPVVGFGLGAVAGHFLIDENNNEKAAVAVLLTSLALVVPSIVITVAATAYDPVDDFEERTDQEVPEADQQEPETVEDVLDEEASREMRTVAAAGTGMVRIHEGGVALTMPGLTVGRVYTPEELARYGGQQATEVQLSLVSGSF